MKKIKDLIKVKPLRETTLSLIRAIKSKPKETVGSYIFTNSIRDDFEKILDSIVSNRGGGFWIQAEYGAGKTHFIATLSCLLIDTSESLWNLVENPEIQNYRFKLAKMKLFPVIINLKGEASTGDTEEKLLRVIERHIEKAVQDENLQDKLTIATSDEIINWYNSCSQGQRDAIDVYISQTGVDPKSVPSTQLALLIRKYCDRENITPNISVTTKDRMTSIYNQLLQNGYTGMLFVIDEYATRQLRHHKDSKEYADDEEVLETLSWVLPKDLGLNTYIIVASHLSAPTKLMGDRFKEIFLLADKTLHEYDIIISRRVKEIIDAKEPEIEQYYQYYYKNFDYFKSIDKDYFYSVFPFHPRCFEALRNITKTELPTARAGINILHDVLLDAAILEKESLLPLSDLLLGFQPKDFEIAKFQKSNRSFKSAIEGINGIELDDEDRPLAQRVVKALFLWNLAYLDVSKYLSIQDLTEIELVLDGIIKGSDQVQNVLVKLRDLSQVEYVTDKGAKFMVTGEEAIRPSEEFAKIKRKLAKQPEKIDPHWEKNLILTPEQTGGGRGALLSGYSFYKRNKINIKFKKIEYPGEIIVGRDWRPEYGESLGEDIHFRIVLLTRNIQVDSKVIRDRRIGVCVPDSLNGRSKEATLNHLVITEMEKEYDLKREPETEKIRQWIMNKKREYIEALLDSQMPVFASGKVYTQQALAIDVKRVFATVSIVRTADLVANNLMSDAYQKPLIDSLIFRNNFTPKDAKKVFNGFFEKGAGSASISACENFGPGLGLSRSSSPKTFDASHNRVFAYLKKKLDDSSNFEFRVWEVFRELGRSPYGLTKEIISLNLLCFVRFGDPSVEIRLRSGHKQKIGSSRITSFNVPKVQWRSKFEEDFDYLSESTQVSWNDIVPYARLYAPEQDLKTATKPEEIIEQESRLLISLGNISAKMPTITANLETLWSAFGKVFPYSEVLKNVSRISSSRGYSEFQDILSDIYSGNQDSIENDALTYRNLTELSDQATIILGMRSYLDDAKIPSGKKELTSLKDFILNGLDPESFANDLSKFDKISEHYENFKKQYKPRYQIHHRDYNLELSEALRQLQEATTKIESIQRLNDIGLNLPTLQAVYSNLEQKIEPCNTKDPVNVDSSAICKECQTVLTDIFDESETNAFLEELDDNIEHGLNGLGQLLTSSVLALDKEKKLDVIMNSVKTNDMDSFVTNFSKPLSEYIKALLAKANIETINFSVSDFVRRHSFVEEEKIDEITKAFKNELLNAVEKAKEEKPGKKIRIALGE